MSVQKQEDIDALLAEVTALANEAVGDEVSAPVSPGAVASQPAAAGAAPGGLPSQAPRFRDPGAEIYRILNIEVPVIVQLAERTMPLSEIVNLSSGAIIEFEKAAEAELDLMINNKCIGQGQAVKVGENFGLRVTSIGSVRERIEAMRR